jgi:nucleotide-binding universal stress UspA family protein
MIKDILVNLLLGGSHDRARDYAVSLAEMLDSHLTAIAFAYAPIIPMAAGVVVIPAELIDAQRAENQNAARLAKSNFEKAIGTAGLRVDCNIANASAEGAIGLFARIARCFDLTVLQQADERHSQNDLIIEAALFNGGRPVIVVPHVHSRAPSFKRVLICWDGSKPAARAIADAIPLLGRAGKVEVITIAEANKITEDFPGAEIGQHLARHGLKIEVKRIDTAGMDVGNAILSIAADISADFIVMGAYGHTRIREFVLGGVTNTILSSMTVPVLMSR